MLTVAFATRNRAEQLAIVMEAFAGLVSPPGGWKLVVADNGSTDGTQALLKQYRERLPLETLFEPRAGKNTALNRAIASFEGDLVVLTDDDVLPEPDWLLRLEAAAEAHPEASLFGGTILPSWPEALPPWLDEAAVDFGMLFALVSRQSGPCDFRVIFGPNMAVRRTVFARGHRFDESIGPDGKNPRSAMGSETEFNRRLADAGHRAYFVADARVRHIIRPEQFEETWILNRAFRNGLGTARTNPPALTRGTPITAGQSWQLLARVTVFRLAARAAARLPPSSSRLRLMFKDRWFAGLAEGMRLRALELEAATRGSRSGTTGPTLPAPTPGGLGRS
ncbi:MAG: glycosyltransferase [Alphaproteobacteria bacterium]|nr:glycosyltransferase [Alphaproteobacteria bacterium]